MPYSREYLEDLRGRADIVEVVQAFMPLKARGSGRRHSEYLGLCPFYPEKTPSFAVSQTKQFYHCYGCGVTGSVTQFLHEHQKMTFQQAVMWLAKRYRFYPKEWARKRRQRAQKEKSKRR